MVALRFYGSLTDFLAGHSGDVTLELRKPAAVKDVIESCGVPHPEIALIIVDGESVAFNHRISGSERVAVYPIGSVLPLHEISLVLPDVLEEQRFVLDGHLGKLAAYLRALGYDVRYDNDPDDADLAQCSHDDMRILLTRDVGLLKRKLVAHGYWVRSTDPETQLFEVAQRFHLADAAQPFSRCVTCNGALKDVAKAAIAHLLPPRTLAYHHAFRQCVECQQVFWPGAHYDRMARLIAAVCADSRT